MSKIRISQGTGEWKPLPEGQYDFKITNVETTTSGGGNPQLKLHMEVVGGEYDGKKSTYFLSLLQQSLWVLYNITDALQIERTETGEVDEAGQPVYEFEADDMVGAYVRFNVGIREYNGKKNNTFNDPQLSPKDPMYASLVASANGNPVAAASTPKPVVVQQPAVAQAPVPATAGAGAVRRRGRVASA
ncbi:MAG: DUF669 domain-containing protein [Myxococcales bacterium]|nr:DUF669 domain-containing protein [Myxococcales bacterium]